MTQPNEEEPTTNELFIFEQVKDRYNAEFNRAHILTGQANNLVGWAGLIISIVLAGGGFFSVTDKDARFSLDIYDIYVLGGLLASLVGSLVLGLFASRLKPYQAVPEPRNLIEDYGDSPRKKTLRTVAVEMTFATELNMQLNNSKASFVTASWVSFIAGMGLTAIFIVMQFSKLLANG